MSQKILLQNISCSKTFFLIIFLLREAINLDLNQAFLGHPQKRLKVKKLKTRGKIKKN